MMINLHTLLLCCFTIIDDSCRKWKIVQNKHKQKSVALLVKKWCQFEWGLLMTQIPKLSRLKSVSASFSFTLNFCDIFAWYERMYPSKTSLIKELENKRLHNIQIHYMTKLSSTQIKLGESENRNQNNLEDVKKVATVVFLTPFPNYWS